MIPAGATTIGGRRGKTGLADALVLSRALLHASDVSNPGKERAVAAEWQALLAEEFLRQGDDDNSPGETCLGRRGPVSEKGCASVLLAPSVTLPVAVAAAAVAAIAAAAAALAAASATCNLPVSVPAKAPSDVPRL